MSTQEKDSSSDPFAFSITQLQSLVDPKDASILQVLGGTSGILSGLHVDPNFGISNDEKSANNSNHSITIVKRQEVFGANRLAPVKSKSFLRLVWEALQDKVMILLSIAAVVSLSIGIYQDIKGDSDAKPITDINGNTLVSQKPHWIEGVAILVAIVIVVLAGSINDFRKEKQFQKLNAQKEDRSIKVIRDGETILLSVYDLVVGDIMKLEPGDIIPADGVLISGHNLTCDESSATGESDAIKKRPVEDIISTQARRKSSSEVADDDLSALPNINELSNTHASPKSDPFLLSGAKVLEGVGQCVTINVGEHSFNGKIMMNLRTENQETPLQEKLSALANRISKLGGAAALLMFVVLIIRYFAQWNSYPDKSFDKVLSKVVNILITTVTVVVVAVPEGLPLAVTLALAFATVRMLKDNNLVRELAACETMGNATTVCSDKTGTLTQNKMTVVAGTIGSSFQFLQNPATQSSSRRSVPPIKQDELMVSIPKNLLEILANGIAINSSAFESTSDQGEITLVGSKTEIALLNWLSFISSQTFKEIRNNCPVVELWPFSSERKSMATLVRLVDSKDKYRLYIKGASEIILSRCSEIVQVSRSKSQDSTNPPLAKDDFSTRSLDSTVSMAFQHRISEYAEKTLRTISLAYKDYTLSSIEINQLASLDSEDRRAFWDARVQEDAFILLGVVGIEDPLRDGVPEAVAACARAGVVVRMVTGDNVLTAKSIATKCGIYQEGSVIMEGPEFRRLTSDQMNAVIPRLRVLARSSPEDKMKLVKKLKQLGETVAVTGDGTNDAPALKAADIGFSMGIAGTEVAKEASAIILMDDNFSSIVKAIMWGRTVNDAVKKFLQFQLTVNITAVLVTFVSATINENETSALRAVQLLWVNLIMDTLAALALATDPPVESVLDRPPDSRKASLISLEMWKMIIGQAIFQVTICFALLYGGRSFFRPDVPDAFEESLLETIVFNSFVFLQVFNQLNCRRIDSGLNIFQGITKNYYFIVIFFLIIFFQVIIINFGGVAFETVPLDRLQWAVSILIGLLSIPIGVIIRMIPLDLFASLGSHHQQQSDSNGTSGRLPTQRNSLSSPRKSFFTAAMVPSMVATSVGVGLTPHNQAPVQEWLNKSPQASADN